MKARRRGCLIGTVGLIFVVLYYLVSLFASPIRVTSVEDTEGYDLAQNPLWVNLTENKEALEKLEEFKEEYQGLRPKQQEALLRQFIPLIGVNGILDSLEQDASTAQQKCHSQAHIVGISATWFTDELDFLLAVVGNRCDSAAFHGVVESLLLNVRSLNQNKDLTLLGPTIRKICAHPAVTRVFTSGECAHGIGYALMMMDAQYPDALKACFFVSQLPGLLQPGEKTENWAHYCSEGVFKNYLHNCDCESSPEPCSSSTLAPGACWVSKFADGHALHQDQSSKLDKFGTCTGLTNLRQPPCFYGLGKFLSAFLDSGDLPMCTAENVTKQGKLACVDGYISGVALSMGSEEARTYCGAQPVAASQELAEVCQESATAPFSMTKDMSVYISSPQIK